MTEGKAEPYLSTPGCPVHLHTQVISILLPVKLAIHYIEEVPHTDLVSGWDLHQGYSCRDIFILWDPECNDVVARRPGEIPVNGTQLLSRRLHKSTAESFQTVATF